MALHGKIMLNDEVLATWEAVRKTPKPIRGINDYDCRVDYVDSKGIRHTRTTTRYHNYDDGAVKLALRVIKWAAEVVPVRP